MKERVTPSSKSMTKPNSHILCRLRNSQGFSIMELVVSVAILGMLMAIALPNVQAFTDSFARTDTLQQLQFDLSRARSTSLSEGVRSVVTVGDNGNTYSAGLDYYPYENTTTAETTLFQRDLHYALSVSFSAPIIFDSRGFLIDEDGTPTTATITVSSEGTTFCTGTILATGATTFSC